MKNQKGFIQIPLLIAIIAGVLVLGGVGYFGVRQYQNHQAKQVEEKRLADEAEKARQEKDKQAQDLITAQQKALEETKKEIENFKNFQGKNINNNPKGQSGNITSGDLQPYLNGIAQIECRGAKGSGSFWSIGGKYFVLTNYHVITDPYTDGSCHAEFFDQADGSILGSYSLYVSDAKQWNNYADISLLPIERNIEWDKVLHSPPINNLDYKISSLPKCPSALSIGSPIVIAGYPAFGMKDYTIGSAQGIQSSLIVTNGVISGYDSTVVKPIGNLPYPNYFVSAKIDSGNSGGIAISKNENGLCVLGVPTWLNVGNYETQGLVQNIHNIMYMP